MNNRESDLDRNRAVTKAKPHLTELVKYSAESGAYNYLLTHISEAAASFLFDNEESWLRRFEKHVAELEPEEEPYDLEQLLSALGAANWDDIDAIVQFCFVLAAEQGVLEFSTHIVPITSHLIANLNCWARRQHIEQCKKQPLAVDQIHVKKPRSHNISRTVSGRVEKITSTSRSNPHWIKDTTQTPREIRNSNFTER
ncbi:hypothetical protein PtrSN002B_008529 [Pyrenophora tritici-repentis]|nr:hypothetical protein PtrV1_01477 [Pyrenophora tritici-repentis]KAF7454214.1 hypothetical protein A1F99_014720 [Pyrenophora tritici-repentis]KAF7577308.1 hypothetical protein PtrM4_015480 [Pyrenophora tritici-repentis]KAG9387963.1 hypothetical protein A1F94_000855 [Pyrenophora tritici-repentis]KAI0573371.1 hypothetical protein Alg215_09239 [Pyrenophora tritici-repentis]